MKHHYITIRYLLATVFAACWQCTALASDKDDLIAKLQTSGQLRLDCKAGKAWIDPALWQAGDADVRENFATAIFESCQHSVKDIKSMDIYDAKSEKKLGTYTADGVFKAD